MQVWFPASLSGLRIRYAISCGLGHRCSWDIVLWLWHKPAAAALIWPLVWELPCATSAAIKKEKEKKKKKRGTSIELLLFPKSKTERLVWGCFICVFCPVHCSRITVYQPYCCLFQSLYEPSTQHSQTSKCWEHQKFLMRLLIKEWNLELADNEMHCLRRWWDPHLWRYSNNSMALLNTVDGTNE